MILIINSSKRRARELSELLRIMGYLAYPILPRELGREMSLAYRAAVISGEEGFADLREFVREIRAYSRSLPLFLISDSEEYEKLFTRRLSSLTSPAELIGKIREELKALALPLPGEYRATGFFASVDSVTPSFLGKSIKFTHTETMILRYLIASYPTPKSASEILLHAFRQSKLPEPASVRTQISCMNKKLRESEGRSLIEFIPDLGYRLIAPAEHQYSLRSQGTELKI